MKFVKDTSGGASSCYPVHGRKAFAFVLLTMVLFTLSVFGQEKHLIQIKTFDQQLQPYKNVEVSINGKEFIAVSNKGTAFIELTNNDLPVKTIKVKNDLLEAASWNYSKGILEIIIRKKNYQLVQVIVKDVNNAGIPGLKVVFNGRKPVTATTNAEGKCEVPLALDDKITSTDQFSINDYQILKLQVAEPGYVLIADHVKPETSVQETPVTASKVDKREYFKDFDLTKLDSIQSLTVFYAIFKDYQIKDMSEATKKKVDAKFNELVEDLQDSLRARDAAFIGKISDSSFVSDDIKNLLQQATLENQMLGQQRTDFDEKIKLINDKLAAGIEKMDPQTRSKLLSDLALLERLLTENESRFYKNQNDYRHIINSLKEKFFDFENLENRLSESEAQRLEEQRIFRQRLVGISAVVIVFAIMIVLLIYFSNKLRQQKKELVLANAEVKRMNENLEGIVFERTKELEEAHQELDTFLYRASHDLRSPVCSIIGLCNIALHLSNGESKELVQKVANTTTGMDKLLKKLSIISEINQPSNFSSITLQNVVESMRYKYITTIKEHHINLVIDCPAHLTINSYPDLIEVILTNLLENALFYSVMKHPDHAQVEIRASIKNDQLEISVYDNGIGIEDNIRHRLYDMFFKGNVNSKGNGLGLYIVHKSVQALDGTISLESKAGQFTKFLVRLPLKPMEEARLIPVATAEFSEV